VLIASENRPARAASDAEGTTLVAHDSSAAREGGLSAVCYLGGVFGPPTALGATQELAFDNQAPEPVAR
jgi:hypothetical protein